VTSAPRSPVHDGGIFRGEKKSQLWGEDRVSAGRGKLLTMYTFNYLLLTGIMVASHRKWMALRQCSLLPLLKNKKKGHSFNDFCVGKSDKLELARPVMVGTQEGFWECFA